MKKIQSLFILMISASTIYAQDISDAVRFSQSEIQGTARFRAMSGAFGALGGDMSAVSINPAGSAVFTQSHASFTLSNLSSKNNTQYFNGSTKTSESDFDINQGGASFIFANNNPDSPWRKFTIGVAYDKTNDYDNTWNAVGTNTNDDGEFSNSIASYFNYYANLGNGVPLHVISLNEDYVEDVYKYIGNNYGENSFYYQQAFLGYQAFVLDPLADNDNNTEYAINSVGSGNFSHDYLYVATGLNGKIAFNMAAQYGDNLYLGLNLNSHFINYDRKTSLLEDNNNGGTIEFIDFDNTLSTSGSGFSFQLGSIFKVTNEFRVGLTYDSPTWYTISEETTQYINSNLADSDIQYISSIVNVYPNYRLQTPGKITGSLAYVFGTQGLISFDYSHKDYSATKFKPTGDYTGLNTEVSNVLTGASTYRIGGEYKVQQFSFRGGYRFEESPYVNGSIVGDLNGYSLGLGYNFGNTRLDLTYDYFERDSDIPLYNVGLTDTANVLNKNSNVTLSLSFNL